MIQDRLKERILTFVRMTTTISVILNLIQNQLDPDFRQDDDSRAVIPDLIRNLCYCQKTADPDFRQSLSLI